MGGIAVTRDEQNSKVILNNILERLTPTNNLIKTKSINPIISIGKARLQSNLDSSLFVARSGEVVVVDGEIYDDTGPVTDPALFVANYFFEGKLDKLSWLNGSFSAIIAEPKSSTITLVTDRLGSVSLFVWRSGKNISAASSLNALLADNRVPKRISVQGISELLNYQRTISDHTQYADIRVMPAAQIWQSKPNNWRETNTRRLVWSPKSFNEKQFSERLSNGLKQSVNRRTSDSYRHGLLLSGGLDARWVLAAKDKSTSPLSCLTVSTHENYEVGIAQKCAKTRNHNHYFTTVNSDSLFQNIDSATIDSDGLFPAPLNLYGQNFQFSEKYDVLLSGHGLDYTVRGYYLPCKFFKILGSNTRIPRLRSIKDASAKTVSSALRVGINPSVMKQILSSNFGKDIQSRRELAMGQALEAVDFESPYDAWDAFLLHCLGRHYAYSDFVAMRKFVFHRAPAFDPDFFDVYLEMPASMRANGAVAQHAMRILGDDLMAIPDANTGFSARIKPLNQIAMLLSRAACRRVGILKQKSLGDPTWTHGSWANYNVLMRRDRLCVERLKALHSDPIFLDTGLFNSTGIKMVVDDFLQSGKNHHKLLLQLLTLQSWFRQNDYTDIFTD